MLLPARYNLKTAIPFASVSQALTTAPTQKWPLEQQLECWFASPADSRFSGLISCLYTSQRDSGSADLLAQQFVILQLSIISIHFSSDSWSADLLAQQIRDLSAWYHPRTSLGVTAGVLICLSSNLWFSSSVPYPYTSRATARVLICLPSRFAILRLSIVPVHFSIDREGIAELENG